MVSKIEFVFLCGVFFMLYSCGLETKQQGYHGFKTEGSRLLNDDGSAFVMRGINVPMAWYPQKCYESLDEIARHGVNCVRIVWESHLPAGRLDRILQKCVELEMIPIIELHDVTGERSAARLTQMAAYFVGDEMKAIIQKYERYLLINIANEWGDNELTADYWRDAYKTCIALLRQEGIESVIVIDAPGWGQNSRPILLYGKELIDEDPLHNLLFSIHLYGSWNDAAKIEHDLQLAVKKSLPVIVGEFGYNYNEGDNNLNCRVNHQQILQSCSDLDIGYLAWSWTGNNGENSWLNLVENNDWKTLTHWGEEIFNSPLGITATAKKAGAFKN